jgi:hypothetical protein
MFLPMLVACFAAMLASTLLRDAPIYDSLREHTLHRERVLWQKTQKKGFVPSARRSGQGETSGRREKPTQLRVG